MFITQTALGREIRFYFGGKPSAPKMPKPPTPAKAADNTTPTIDSRRPRGPGSTIMTSGDGVQNQTSKKTILGG